MKKSKTISKEGNGGDAPSQLIDARIKKLGGWRGETLARVRARHRAFGAVSGFVRNNGDLY